MRDEAKVVNSSEYTIKPIEPQRIYTLMEIIDLGLIPNINRYKHSYTILYRFIMEDNVSKKPIAITRTDKIKPELIQVPWAKNKRWGIRGVEIIKFLKLHGYLN